MASMQADKYENMSEEENEAPLINALEEPLDTKVMRLYASEAYREASGGVTLTKAYLLEIADKTDALQSLVTVQAEAIAKLKDVAERLGSRWVEISNRPVQRMVCSFCGELVIPGENKDFTCKHKPTCPKQLHIALLQELSLPT